MIIFYSVSQSLWCFTHITINICAFLKTISAKCKTSWITCKITSLVQNSWTIPQKQVFVSMKLPVIKMRSPDKCVCNSLLS